MENPLAHIALVPPPPGVTANLVDPVSRERASIALHSTFLTLITFFLAMRIYTRKFISRWIGWDDCNDHPSSFVEYGLDANAARRCLSDCLCRSVRSHCQHDMFMQWNTRP